MFRSDHSASHDDEADPRGALGPARGGAAAADIPGAHPSGLARRQLDVHPAILVPKLGEEGVGPEAGEADALRAARQAAQRQKVVAIGIKAYGITEGFLLDLS